MTTPGQNTSSCPGSSPPSRPPRPSPASSPCSGRTGRSPGSAGTISTRGTTPRPPWPWTRPVSTRPPSAPTLARPAPERGRLLVRRLRRRRPRRRHRPRPRVQLRRLHSRRCLAPLPVHGRRHVPGHHVADRLRGRRVGAAAPAARRPDRLAPRGRRHADGGRPAHRQLLHPPRPALRARHRRAAGRTAARLGVGGRCPAARDPPPPRALPGQGPLFDGLVLPGPRRGADGRRGQRHASRSPGTASSCPASVCAAWCPTRG